MTTAIGVVAALLSGGAIVAGVNVLSAAEDVRAFRAAAWCAPGITQECLDQRTSFVINAVAGGRSSSITVAVPGSSDLRLGVFEDYGGVTRSVKGQAATLTFWHSDPVVVATGRGSFALTSMSPQAAASNAYALVLLLVFFAAGLWGIVITSRRPTRTPGSYVLPYVVRPGRAEFAVLIVPVLGVLALAFDPFRWTYTTFDLARSLGPYAVFLGLLLHALPPALLRRVILGRDAIEIRGLLGRQRLAYTEIESARVQTQRVQIGRVGSARPVVIGTYLFPRRSVAVMLDVIRARARSAEVDPASAALHPRMAKVSLRATMNWRALRLSDRLSGLELIGTACGFAMLVFFGAGLVYGVVTREWGLATLAAGIVLATAVISPISVMQMRYRRALKRQLAERGVTVRGEVIENSPISYAQGTTSIVRYRFRSRDGASHEVAAFDRTDLAAHWPVGRAALVRYDPTDPETALLVEPDEVGFQISGSGAR